MQHSAMALGILSVLAAGCALDTLDVGGSQQHVCETFGCGTNSGMVNGFRFNETDTGGAWSQDGFRMVEFQEVGGAPLNIVVEDGQFIIVNPDGSTDSTIEEDLTIHLLVERDTGVPGAPYEEYTLVIEPDDWEASWATGGPDVPRYLVSYIPPASTAGPISVCWAASDTDPSGWESTYAVVVVDERYDVDAAEVLASGAPAEGWFNIACAGSAMAKMKLMAHDPENPDPAFATSASQRQAAIKMIVADYCGDGTSYTVTGQPLEWQNQAGWFPAFTAFSMEALWDENGALCLDTPRMVLREDVSCANVLPTCGGIAPGAAEWTTKHFTSPPTTPQPPPEEM